MENINTIKIIWFRFPFFYRLYNFFCLYSFSETSEINTHECQSVSWAWEENVSDLFQCPEVTQTMFFSNPSFHINIFWCLYLEGKHNLGPWMSIFSMKPDFSFYIELKKKKKKSTTFRANWTECQVFLLVYQTVQATAHIIKWQTPTDNSHQFNLAAVTTSHYWPSLKSLLSNLRPS